MERTWFAAGAVLGLLAVAAGAFGAHALEVRIPAERLANWELAARYQGVHALALLAVGLAGAQWPRFPLLPAGLLFVFGTVIFSGTLYGLALGAPRWWGAITPIGGLSLLGGWLALAIGVLRS